MSSRFWTLPPGVHAVLIDSEDQLDSFSDLLDAALACGMDAEWPPEETTGEQRGGGPPHATLVQLALWLPPGSPALPPELCPATSSSSSGGGSGGSSCSSSSCTSSASCLVLLLDMLALPQAAAKRALQQLFRNKSCLKLGFGLVHDLRAIGAALGGEGGSCIAVVEPACDVGSVHRFLRHRHVLGVNKAVDLGLSGLVDAQLGRPLDKALQCSAWGERPLSGAQLQYAAADAACLLALLGSLVAVVGQPEEWPMTEAAVEASGPQPAAGAAAVAARSEDQQAAANGAEESAAEGADGEAEGAPEVQAADGSGGSNSSRSSGNASEQTGAAGPAAPQQQQQQQTGSEAAAAAHQASASAVPTADLLGGCSVQQLRAAASAWGVRLEISGARAVKRGGRRGQRQRREARRGSGRLDPEAPCGFPLHVPFWDAQQQPTGQPRFLCDVMAEGLARQLRLCGFDTESLQATMEKAPRHAIYRTMVERAEAEQRVVLTRDRTFVAANYSDQAYLVQRDTKREQLEEVIDAFKLSVQEEDVLTRCARCNGDFIPEPLPPGLLPEGHDVPPGILATVDEYWVCSRCSGVYWQGSQYGRAKKEMNDLIAKLKALA
ncbi:hypothetical protein COHA_007736 [Chlorella ohadii]|uniref:Mut7-C RNAse domain-containing protein n=1 Tax=Chlorella ohadii TaxID=2649997 RepID=A0AAD5H2A6_9CHLO|nr:hypothetical protein COHA_007736 [Chlorella ohadii]